MPPSGMNTKLFVPADVIRRPSLGCTLSHSVTLPVSGGFADLIVRSDRRIRSAVRGTIGALKSLYLIGLKNIFLVPFHNVAFHCAPASIGR
jgi:hypothetical protein